MSNYRIGLSGHKFYEVEKGNLFLMLVDAIKLREECDYQPPNPCEPNVDDEKEKQYQDECEKAQDRLEEVMKFMFTALTGKKIVSIE